MIIRTSTFPNGPAKHMDANDVVQKLQSNGRFKDIYVGALAVGDEYYAPSPTSKPRTNADRWAYMVDNKIEFIHQFDVDGKLDCIDIYSGTFDGTVIVQDQDALKSLSEAIDYLMDMDETN